MNNDRFQVPIKLNMINTSFWNVRSFSITLLVFRSNVLPPFSGSKINPRKQAVRYKKVFNAVFAFFVTYFLFVVYSAYSSILKTEEINSSETSVKLLPH
jgi:hypothetical protein